MLRFDVEKERWEHVADMRTGRAEHAVASIKIPDSFSDIWDCESSSPSQPQQLTGEEVEDEIVETGILITGGELERDSEVFIPSSKERLLVIYNCIDSQWRTFTFSKIVRDLY